MRQKFQLKREKKSVRTAFMLDNASMQCSRRKIGEQAQSTRWAWTTEGIGYITSISPSKKKTPPVASGGIACWKFILCHLCPPRLFAFASLFSILPVTITQVGHNGHTLSRREAVSLLARTAFPGSEDSFHSFVHSFICEG